MKTIQRLMKVGYRLHTFCFVFHRLFHRLRGTETNPQTITTKTVLFLGITLIYFITISRLPDSVRLWFTARKNKTTSKMLKTVEKHTKKLSSWAQNAIISHYFFVCFVNSCTLGGKFLVCWLFLWFGGNFFFVPNSWYLNLWFKEMTSYNPNFFNILQAQSTKILFAIELTANSS